MNTILRTAKPKLPGAAIRCRIHVSSTTASKCVDFHALDAKWKVKWAAKENKQDQKRHYWPLAPLRFSMLGVRKPYGYNRSIQVKYHRKKEHLPFDTLLPFAMPKDSDEFLKLCESDPQLKFRILQSGIDLTRTSIIFDAQNHYDLQRNNGGELHMQHQFFESIWEAISFAHQSYRHTLRGHTHPDVPDALYECNSETWDDHLVDETASLVHIPPHEPKISDRNDSNENGEKIWLAAQEAMVAFRKHLSANNIAAIMKRLTRLTKEIIEYDSADTVFPHVHYHAARILINLITPFAPSFAEECWVLLHYGRQSLLGVHDNAITIEDEQAEKRMDADDAEKWEPPSLKDVESDLEEEEKEWEFGYTHLSRRWYPDTLNSLFQLAPPTPATTGDIRLLKQRVASHKSEESTEERMDEED
ncbi:MAG: hypothetical protein Q9180_005450 [Flavoplaca navasiana]